MDAQEKEAWGSGEPYERYVGRWSRLVAREFLKWLDNPPGQVWADVGCGTGALSALILENNQPNRIHAIDRSTKFISGAKMKMKDQRVNFCASDAAALPWAADSCDVAVSGLVLNFVPDATAMVREMARVTRPKGLVAAYVWDYSGRMEMMRHFWDAAVQVDPKAAALDQGERFPLCRPDPLKKLWEDLGLSSVTVRAIDIPTIFRDFEDYWQPFLGKQGSAPTFLASTEIAVRNQIREILQSRLVTAADGSIHLTARAWAVRGTG